MRIAVEALTYSYPVTGRPSGKTAAETPPAIENVQLSIPAGQRLAIVGRNGAGKSTLVRHLAGLLRPTSGRVLLDGHDIASQPISELAAHIGFVFQNPDEQLFARTVVAEVSFGPRNLAFGAARREALVARALAATGITDPDAHPYHLSFAQRKRVALASVLAMDPEVLVLDEPTTGQDAPGSDLIARLVSDLAGEGRTVIAVSHDLDYCAENFERIVVMAGGRIVADGAPADVFGDGEMLARAGIVPPQLVRLADRLGWDEVPLTPAQFVDAYERRHG